MSHQIYYRDPFGNLQTTISKFVKLEYTRAENKVGYLTLDLDPSTIDTTLFRLDCRLEPWRTVGANPPYLDGDSIYFLRRWGVAFDASGKELIRLEARDANYLLSGRNVAYNSGTAQAEKSAVAIDNMMKAIVRENLGSLATDTARDLSAYLTVQVDLGLAPTATKAFSHRPVLDVLQELAAESFNGGTYLVFDVAYVNATTLEFRTYTGQRGINHGRSSGSTVVISRKSRNLEVPEAIEDHIDEMTYAYAGGMGTGADRTVNTASNPNAIGLSPFNRRELWIDARNTDTSAAITSEAKAGLQAARARKSLTGRIIDTDGCMYGVHYRYGDVVYVEYRGWGYDAHLDTLHVTVEGGQETIDNQVRAEAA